MKRARGGFTLVELLVSVTVAALLLGLLVFVMVRSLQISQTSADALGAYSSAATAVDLLATDLASLSVTRQPFEYLQALPESNPGLASIPAPNVQPMRLMMLVTSPEDSAQPSASPSPAATPIYPDQRPGPGSELPDGVAKPGLNHCRIKRGQLGVRALPASGHNRGYVPICVGFDGPLQDVCT